MKNFPGTGGTGSCSSSPGTVVQEGGGAQSLMFWFWFLAEQDQGAFVRPKKSIKEYLFDLV